MTPPCLGLIGYRDIFGISKKSLVEFSSPWQKVVRKEGFVSRFWSAPARFGRRFVSSVESANIGIWPGTRSTDWPLCLVFFFAPREGILSRMYTVLRTETEPGMDRTIAHRCTQARRERFGSSSGNSSAKASPIRLILEKRRISCIMESIRGRLLERWECLLQGSFSSGLA